ncbi:MAG: RIP metalloprotease RseP [Patescibacteria group bacterium]|jgi:regulator of sigma E protease
MITLITFIIILGLLIFVHELGHFVAAKKAGIKVDEFGFGYPPRIIGTYKDPKTKKFVLVLPKRGKGKKQLAAVAGQESEENFPATVYSLNWLPLGGFCKMKGENGDGKSDPDSFSAKKAWQRIIVLIAGVAMNFVLAALVLMIGFKVGLPTAIDSQNKSYAKDQKVQIMSISTDSPAEKVGLKIGDQVVSINNKKLENVTQVQKAIDKNKGKEIDLKIKRYNENLDIKIEPRKNPPENQGALGVGLVETGIVSYPWLTSIWKGITATFSLTIALIVGFYDIIKNLFVGNKIGADVAGPIGIAVMTGQVTKMGFSYVLQFVALLSINLAIINALPIPAIDGGRILFIIIEKIRRKPISMKVENIIHTTGFALLILLMVVVTFRDVFKFKDIFINLWNKIF